MHEDHTWNMHGSYAECTQAGPVTIDHQSGDGREHEHHWPALAKKEHLASTFEWEIDMENERGNFE